MSSTADRPGVAIEAAMEGLCAVCGQRIKESEEFVPMTLRWSPTAVRTVRFHGRCLPAPMARPTTETWNPEERPRPLQDLDKLVIEMMEVDLRRIISEEIGAALNAVLANPTVQKR